MKIIFTVRSENYLAQARTLVDQQFRTYFSECMQSVFKGRLHLLGPLTRAFIGIFGAKGCDDWIQGFQRDKVNCPECHVSWWRDIQKIELSSGKIAMIHSKPSEYRELKGR